MAVKQKDLSRADQIELMLVVVLAILLGMILWP